MGAIEVLLSIAGFFFNFWRSKSEKQEWMAKAADALHRKGWVDKKFVLELEKSRSAYLDNLILQNTKEQGMKPEMKDKPLHRNIRVLMAAAGQLGTKEYPGARSNPVVEKYLDYGQGSKNEDSGLTDDVPWCAGFVCYILEIVGMGSTNSLMARSFEKWGVSKMLAPLPGDIVTFWRKSKASGFGHVGIYLGHKDANHVFVLGGNQRDEVNVTVYPITKMTDIRRSSKARPMGKKELSKLMKIRDDILKEYGAKAAGSVV